MFIENWPSALSQGTLYLVGVRWGHKQWWLVNYEIGNKFSIFNYSDNNEGLILSIFHEESACLFEVRFETIKEYKFSVEEGFPEFWNARPPKSNTFYIYDSNRQPLGDRDLYKMYMIVTASYSIEVTSSSRPKIMQISVVRG
ncbi:hypothetical protein D8T47_13770 [Vibrio vulnificus]|nr:hypothetical protein D8T47_13770 [Vibrio vulnificus]